MRKRQTLTSKGWKKKRSELTSNGWKRSELTSKGWKRSELTSKGWKRSELRNNHIKSFKRLNVDYLHPYPLLPFNRLQLLV